MSVKRITQQPTKVPITWHGALCTLTEACVRLPLAAPISVPGTTQTGRNVRVPVAIGEKRTLGLVETADQTKDSQLANQVAENDGAFNLTWDRKTQFGLPVTGTADRLAKIVLVLGLVHGGERSRWSRQ